jgi:hypothetical protein
VNVYLFIENARGCITIDESRRAGMSWGQRWSANPPEEQERQMTPSDEDEEMKEDQVSVFIDQSPANGKAGLGLQV